MTIENETVRCDAEGLFGFDGDHSWNVKLHQKATHQEILMVSDWDRGWTNVIEPSSFARVISAAA